MAQDRFFGIQNKVNELLGRETEDISSPVFTEALNAYRAWNFREGPGKSIIDFDLTAGPEGFESNFMRFAQKQRVLSRGERTEIVDTLTELHKKIEAVRDKSKIPQLVEFALERTSGSILYAKKLRGDNLDTKTYLEVTNGGELAPYSEQELLRLQEPLLEKAEKAGIPVSTPAEMLAWREQNEIGHQETVILFFRDAIRNALGQYGKFMGEPGDVENDINPVNVDKYFYAWAKTDRRTQKFLVELNFHQGKIWTPGKIEELAGHEVVEHLRRMHEHRKRIQANKMHPFFGLTVVHSSEAVVEEGMALVLPHLVPGMYESLSDEGKFQVDASIFRHITYGNLHLMLNSPERPSNGEAIEYIHKFIPWEPEGEILNQIKWRTEDPELQAYLLSYAQGAKLFLSLAERMQPKEMRDLLKELSERPFTPRQVVRRALEITRAKGAELTNLNLGPNTQPFRAAIDPQQ